MKALLCLALFLSFAFLSFAQNQPKTNEPHVRVMPPDKLKKYNFTPGDTINSQKKFMDYYRNFKKPGPGPLYSHDAAIGKVYTMPYDNMPCLVPDKNQLAPMPCAKPTPQGSMPNATPLYPDSPPSRRKE